MEPRIQFCTSADATRIAYATLGSGRPLLMILGWGTSVEAEWRDPEGRAWIEEVAADRQMIRYERRGCGASPRDVAGFSLEAQLADVEAIIEKMGLPRFDLFGAYDGAAVAAAFAARHPARVERLVLWAPFARGGDVQDADAFNAMIQLWEGNPLFARRSWAAVGFPTGPQERTRWYSEMLKESQTQTVAVGYTKFIRDLDITDMLQRVESPTLVLHRDRDKLVPIRAARTAASLLPNASFVSLPGDEGYPPFGDRAYVSVMKQFLDEDRSSAGRADAAPPSSGTAIILFADIVDSTALTEALGDAVFRDRARKLDDSLRTIIREHDGTPVEGKLLGDGVLATFTSARRAIESALRSNEAAAAVDLSLHLGVHAGDVIREDNNVFGGAVNIAARIAAASEPAQILVSHTVRDLARTSAGVQFDDCGELALKGIGDPVRVWAVRSPD